MTPMTRADLKKHILEGLDDAETQTVFVPRHTLYVALLGPKKKPVSEMLGEFTAEMLAKHCVGHSWNLLGVEFYKRNG